MRSLIFLALLSLIISEPNIDDLAIKLKQNLSKKIEDIPSNANNYIINLNGITQAIK